MIMRQEILKMALENVKKTSYLHGEYRDRQATQHESISNAYAVGTFLAQTLIDWENGGEGNALWDGFSDALRVEHRYLQNVVVLGLLNALHTLKEEEYDARNEFAIECCELLEHVMSYEAHKELRKKKQCPDPCT